jgi:Domain of unknown function (DUF4262)
MPDPDDILRRQQDLITRFGWAVTGVFPTGPDDGYPFAYTVGLTELGGGHPEFVIAGLHHRYSQPLLNDMAGRVRDGHSFTHGQTINDLLHSLDAVLIDGPINADLWPGAAIRRYGADRIRLRQIVWPDRDGHFPWQDGYAIPPGVQPLLGRP